MVEEAKPGTENAAELDPGRDPIAELLALMELAVKYPEIGAPLAQLAFKLGQSDVGNRIVRMGLDGPGPGLEFYFVAANAARRDKRLTDVRKLSIEAVKAFIATEDANLASDDATRLLHLVRLGFATMVFDEKNPKADPWFVEQLAELLPGLDSRLGADAFYTTMLAQTQWYTNQEQSEQSWDKAAELGEPEFTWNARGTWYKDAEGDFSKAQDAYRKGLEKVPSSSLLLHNLAQLLLDKASHADTELADARKMGREADQLLRNALRGDTQKGLRRHIHETIDHLEELRLSLQAKEAASGRRDQRDQRDQRDPEPTRLPEVGEVLKGNVASLTPFGAFVSIPEVGTGLLHKSEISYDIIDDPSTVLAVGDEIEVKVTDVSRRDQGRLRIGLSRKALLPAPEPSASAQSAISGESKPAPREQRQGAGQPRQNPPRQNPPRQPPQPQRPKGDDKLASLGEMLLAKMKAQQQSKP